MAFYACATGSDVRMQVKTAPSVLVLAGALLAGCQGNSTPAAHRSAHLRRQDSERLPGGLSGPGNGLANGAQQETPGASVGPGSGGMSAGSRMRAAAVGTTGGGDVGGR